MVKYYLLLIIFISFLSSAAGKPFSGLLAAPKIDSLQIVFDKQQLILPGESFHIGIDAYYKNGKVKRTVGLKGGTVWWWKYKGWK